MNSINFPGRTTRNVNRLFLGTVIWVLGAMNLLALVLQRLSTVQLLVVSQLIYLLPVLLYIIIFRLPVKKWIPFQKIGISMVLMTVLFIFLLYPLVICLNLFSMFFVTNHLANTEIGLQGNSFWLNLLVMAVIPAVSEEFIFRGIYYRSYREKGILTAAIGCGVTFGLMHMNFNQFIYALVLGVAFCLLMEATGSILATMIAHFILNGWSVVVMEIQKHLDIGETADIQAQFSQDGMLVTFGVVAVIAAFTTCLAGCVLVWIARHCGRLDYLKSSLKPRQREEGQVRGRRTFITPSYLAAGVICIAYMLLIEMVPS